MKEIQGKTFWVTGATGRLGCEVVPRIEALGALVVPIVLDGYPLQPHRGVWISSTFPRSVSCTADLEGLPSPDCVLNLHWRVDRTLPFAAQVLYEIEVNLHRPCFLWKFLISSSCRRFLNVSSLKIFSHLNGHPVAAKSKPKPISAYGIAKVISESFFDSLFQATPMTAVHARLCSVGSVGEHPSQLLSQLYQSAFHNRRINVNIGHLCYLMYIEEAVDLLIAAAVCEEPGPFILAPPEIPVLEVATLFERVSGHCLQAEYRDLQPGEIDPVFISDVADLVRVWTRTIPLEAMLRQFIQIRHNQSQAGRSSPAHRSAEVEDDEKGNDGDRSLTSH